jgi:[acyl-carrier-protein] S-malonyltransferase
MNLILLFPGQGSQTPGMGKDLAAAFPAARDVFDRADAALGVGLSQLCFEGPAEELTLTHNAQPALLAHGAAVWAAIRAELGADVVAAAGHSLGEFTAYHAAESLRLEDALRLVRRRGELMYQSGVARPGAMAAILGDPTQPIEEICAQATREAGLVVPANYNSPGQLVISGEIAGVERAMALAREAGAKRAIRLPVSGAFHSPLMESASDGLREALAGASFTDPHFPVYANVDGNAVHHANRATTVLLEQLSRPVRWIEEVRHMAAEHPDSLWIELGPGAVLAGLLKKIDPSLAVVSCGAPAEVEQLMARVQQTAAGGGA